MSDEPTIDNPAGKLTTEQLLLIKQAARRLKDEFAGTFNEETIERYIADSQSKLEARANFATWLPILIERFTPRPAPSPSADRDR